MNICLSHIISQSTPSYGNRDKIFIRSNSSIAAGSFANSSCWIFSNNHIGTHMDSPYHFCENGKKTFEIPISNFFFYKVGVIDLPCTGAKLIDATDIENLDSIDEDIDLLLIRTGFEKFRTEEKYWNDYPGLMPEPADYFREKFIGLRCVGFDFISLTSWKFRPEGKLSHQEFLCPGGGDRSILIIEDMALDKVRAGLVKVIVAPLFVEDGNGGAVTVFSEVED